VTANRCFGTQARICDALTGFFAGLAERAAEVMRRCRTVLQAQPIAWSQRLCRQLLKLSMWISPWL